MARPQGGRGPLYAITSLGGVVRRRGTFRRAERDAAG